MLTDVVAKRLGVITVGLLGRDGGELAGVVDLAVVAPGQDTARIQEAHQFLLHVWCEYLERELAGVAVAESVGQGRAG